MDPLEDWIAEQVRQKSSRREVQRSLETIGYSKAEIIAAMQTYDSLTAPQRKARMLLVVRVAAVVFGILALAGAVFWALSAMQDARERHFAEAPFEELLLESLQRDDLDLCLRAAARDNSSLKQHKCIYYEAIRSKDPSVCNRSELAAKACIDEASVALAMPSSCSSQYCSKIASDYAALLRSDASACTTAACNTTMAVLTGSPCEDDFCAAMVNRDVQACASLSSGDSTCALALALLEDDVRLCAAVPNADSCVWRFGYATVQPKSCKLSTEKAECDVAVAEAVENHRPYAAIGYEPPRPYLVYASIARHYGLQVPAY